MRVSLSEVEATVRKASVGVGLALGLAEDAGRAAAWAALVGVGDPGLFAAALEALDTGRSVGVDADRAATETLSPVDGAGPLSALTAGPVACDALLSGADAATVALSAVDHPAVVLFEALEVCDGLAGELRVHWRAPDGAAIEVVRRRDGPIDGLAARHALAGHGPADMRLTLTAGHVPPPAAPARAEVLADGVAVDDVRWRCIAALAARLLVEGTEASRLSGAGAGVIDVD